MPLIIDFNDDSGEGGVIHRTKKASALVGMPFVITNLFLFIKARRIFSCEHLARSVAQPRDNQSANNYKNPASDTHTHNTTSLF